MTDLQLSLLAIGGTLVVGVVVFNKWQEYKARKSVDQAFSGGQDDVLMNPLDDMERDAQSPHHERHEPSMDGEDEQRGRYQSPAEEWVQDGARASANPPRELPVDDVIDCVITLEFETPIRGEKLLAEIHDLKYVGKKPIHFVALGHDGNKTVVAHGGAFASLFAGVQMVNRSGPLNELEYSEFVSHLRNIADRLNAHSDIPDMNQVMSMARELHHFMSEHDAQLSVNILANGAPWGIPTLLAALETQGFDVRPDGRLVMPDGEGGILFSLSTNVSVSESITPRMTLLLDVPCVAPSRDAFGAMAACARSLAARMGGTLVDDSDSQSPPRPWMKSRCR